MKTGHLLAFIFLLSTLLTGCRPREAQPLCRVVTQVDIFYQDQDAQPLRHYTSSQKMQAVLLYLRLLKPAGYAQAVPQGPEFHITVHFSDGLQRRYRQKDLRFFAEELRAWQDLDPMGGLGLVKLICLLPSDEGPTSQDTFLRPEAARKSRLPSPNQNFRSSRENSGALVDFPPASMVY